MRAMVLEQIGRPLQLRELQQPVVGANEVLVEVLACGVCRTDLHVLDGELPGPKLPLILGHEIVGTIVYSSSESLQVGERVGVPWLGRTCQQCFYCRRGLENLCNAPLFTGYTRNGGYAEYTVADERFCFRLPQHSPPVSTAPLLCAGLIGYRSLRMCEDSHKIGLYGFGAAAHILCQLITFQNRKAYAFVKPGDEKKKRFARDLGAHWAGYANELPPEKLDAAIIFAPVGALVPAALKAVRKAGTVVCAGIHMSDIPQFPYSSLWEERKIVSVANLTRADGEEFFEEIERFPVKTEITRYRLEEANEALSDLRAGAFQGAAVLVP